MKFIHSPYYNKEFLGEYLYKNIGYDSSIFTVYEYFGLNETQNEYHVKSGWQDYKLKVFDNYYELDCQQYDLDLYLVFDKSVYITGEYCGGIFAPEIVIKTNQNSLLSFCVSNKATIDKPSKKQNYHIRLSKISSVYFYDLMVKLFGSQVSNFFIFDKNLYFDMASSFLGSYKIKCLGSCTDLKKKLLNDEKFKKGIIHIE